MAQMTFDGQFSDLQMKIMSESALQAIYPELVRIQDFAKTFSEAETTPGTAIVVPTYDFSEAADFDADQNNYCSGVNEISASHVILDKHIHKAVKVTARDLAETGINFLKDATTGIASILGRGINKYVFGQMNATNIPLSATLDLSSKAGATALYQAAADNGLDVADSVVVLNPTQFGKLLQHVDFMQYGGTEAIRYGYVPGFVGFKSVVCSTYLPEGVDGVIINRNSLGIAARTLPVIPGAYPATWVATDPTSGLPIRFRFFNTLCDGAFNLDGEVVMGTGLFYAGRKAIRLVVGS